MEMVRVMIADDSDAIRTFLKDVVISSGYDFVAEADNGMDAIDKVKSTMPDILLLDYSMPKKNGLDVLKEIKKFGSTKVIMVTVSDEQELIEKCIQTGAAAYLVKPFNPDMVLKAISYAIEQPLPASQI
jgi:two-component system chemotaxis response regulator CheY